MVDRAIRSCIDFESIDVILSSDSDQILDIGRRYNTILHKRPDDLSGDNIKTYEVIKDISKYHKFEYAITLQPTSPFRTHAHISEAIRKFEKSNADSLCSVVKGNSEILKSFFMKEDYLHGIVNNEYPFAPRQILPPVYKANGAIFITSSSSISENKMYGNKLLCYEMDLQSSKDIDNYENLKGLNYSLHVE